RVEFKRLRHDPDYGAGLIVKPQARTNDIRRSSQPVFPKTMAQDDSARHFLILSFKRAPLRSPRSQKREVSCCHRNGKDSFGGPPPQQDFSRLSDPGTGLQLLKTPTLKFPLLKVSIARKDLRILRLTDGARKDGH